MERTGKRWLRGHTFPADQGLALHHPVTNRLVLSTPLGPLPGAKDTEPPAQGPLCSRTRARIDFQMSRKSKQTKAFTLFTNLSGIVSHGQAQGRAVRVAELLIIPCIPIPSLVGDNTQTCSEVEPKAWLSTEHMEHVPRGKDFPRQGQR